MLTVPAEEAKAEGYENAVKRVGKLIKKLTSRDFSFAEFRESPSVISGRGRVSRLEVVRYVANKLGGVHWDNKRGEWTEPVGSRHRLLDENHIVVGRLAAPLYELLSIAQAVATSVDTIRLIERVAEIAPEPEADGKILRFREGRIGNYAETKFAPKSAARGSD